MYMENLSKLFTWLKSLPVVPKALSCLVILLVYVIVLFSCTSCGTTRAVARTTDNGTTTITITTNNPTSVQASPNVDLKLNGKTE